MKRNKEKVKEYSKKEREKLKGKSENRKEWNRVRKKEYNLKKIKKPQLTITIYFRNRELERKKEVLAELKTLQFISEKK